MEHLGRLDTYFADVAGTDDCPFSAGGASGPGAGDCLGSSPAYYESLRVAPVFGRNNYNLIARTADGLRLRWTDGRIFYDGNTLGALRGAASALKPGQWGSLRTGNVDGLGGSEVLWLDGTALQAWSWTPAQGGWTQLQPSTPLKLTGDWLAKPEYYSTIRTGDVDGDGRDEVIARGPFGIRSWFYNRRGTGGWERYLPDGYPAWPSAGHQNAYTALNALAVNDRIITATAITVRGVWSTQEPPQSTDLTRLQGDLARVAGCTGQAPANPPSYATCTPPSGSTGFGAAEWTDVVNQLLAETYAADQVLGFFAQLDDMRQKLFIAEGAELPAIDNDLQAAAYTPATFSAQSLFAGIMGIGASLAGPAEPELSAAMWVASELASTITGPSPTATSDSLQTTYAGLQDSFAKMVTEIDKSMVVQSQLVRQDQGLLQLVGELRGRGTWAMDTIGMGSAANQGFAIWAYQALMPAVYDRYAISNCWIDSPSYSYGSGECRGPKGLAVIGDTHNFVAIAQRHHWDPDFANWWENVPCHGEDAAFFDGCDWTLPPDDLMNRIWGPVSPDCSYKPGEADTAWTFGCSAGVDVNSSIGANTWLFPTYTGSPDPGTDPGFRASAAAVRAGASAQVGSAAPVRLGRPRHGLRRAVRGRARLRVDTMLPRGMRLAGANVKVTRLLFERGGHGELTRAAWRSRFPTGCAQAETRCARGRLGVHDGPPERAPHAAPHRPAGARAAHDADRRRGVPRAAGLPRLAGLGRARHRAAAARVAARDQRRAHPPSHPRGAPRALRPRRTRERRSAGPRALPQHPGRGGLAVSLRGPSRVQRGTTARYVVRVRNRRRGRDRLRSSLWDVVLHIRRGRTVRIAAVRPGRSRSLMLSRRVPRSARHRFCVDAAATAAGARAAHAKACAAVRAARPPGVTG